MNIKENDKIFLIPTDTIYGISARIDDKKSILKIKKIKKRDKNKSFIVLISKIEELYDFGIKLNQNQKEFLKKVWPGPVSIVFEGVEEKFNYLVAKSDNSLAFRIPNKKELLNLINKIGPIISTSANISGEKNIKNIEDAKKIFGKDIDKYIDQGEIIAKPSTIIKIIR